MDGRVIDPVMVGDDHHTVRFLRGGRKFDGLDALKEQIARDCDDAREALR